MTSPFSTTELKSLLRREMRRQLAALPPSTKAEGSVQIHQRLANAPGWRSAERILGFLPLPSEPDLASLLRSAAAEGRTVCVPRWNETEATYEAAVLPPSGGLRPGPFGILEPSPELPCIPLERLDLVLVPGLAFDRLGRRLGRGRGFLDRLLVRARLACRWGVAFDLQIVDAVPTEPHDVNLHILATPQLWLQVDA